MEIKGETIEYSFKIVTGDVKNAGTDAKVYACVFGENGDTGNLVFPTNKEYFEKGRTDVFKIKGKDVGAIKKLRIGHDGTGVGAGWFLASITINTARGEWTFPCNRWLDKSQDDGQIVRELLATSALGKVSLTNYKIMVTTGNVDKAGTYSNVSICIHGDSGRSTGERWLRANRNNFAKGQTDTFFVEAEDVGVVQKITVAIDNKGVLGMSSSWHCDKVVVRNEKKRRMDFSMQPMV